MVFQTYLRDFFRNVLVIKNDEVIKNPGYVCSSCYVITSTRRGRRQQRPRVVRLGHLTELDFHDRTYYQKSPRGTGAPRGMGTGAPKIVYSHVAVSD